MSQFSNIWPLTRFLQIVVYIDAFNAKSYPYIDAFIAQNYVHGNVFCKKLHSNWRVFLHSVAQESNFEPNFSLEDGRIR